MFGVFGGPKLPRRDSSFPQRNLHLGQRQRPREYFQGLLKRRHNRIGRSGNRQRVSQNSILKTVRTFSGSSVFLRSAECNSAIQQIENLHYTESSQPATILGYRESATLPYETKKSVAHPQTSEMTPKRFDFACLACLAGQRLSKIIRVIDHPSRTFFSSPLRSSSLRQVPT